MLDAHPQLSCTGEHDFLFDHLQQKGEDWTYNREKLAGDRLFAASKLTFPGGLDGREALFDLIGQIGAQGDGLPVLMVHRNLEKLLSILTEAPIVHFVRDPRDVARSSIGMMWAGNVFYGTDTWLKTEREWQRAGKGLGTRVLEVRYEDLVTTPRAVLEAVCRHLNVPYDDRMLSYPETTTYSAPDASLAYQWKTKLSEREVRLVQHKAGPLMQALGYDVSPLPPVNLSAPRRALLWLQNKYSIWTRMVGVYGLVPMLERSAGRRLGIASIEARGNSKMNVVRRRRQK
jgi:hypothetical protein